MTDKLAIHGGDPVRRKKWALNHTTASEELHAVEEVMRSGNFSLFEGSYSPDPPFSFWGGPVVQDLEARWCDYYGIKYAVSMNSATSGLYAAIGALNIGYGDEVIVSPYTMTASAVCALVYGAIPVFADVELSTGSLDPAGLARKITPRTKAIVVVHQFGMPADMDAIMTLAKENNIKIIEDCAQAHGARYKGRYVGTFGDIGIFSLNVNKTIQSGEGGVCITADEDLRYRLALIRNHGEAVVGPAGYDNIENIIGFNYRMTELQAAVAIAQLRKLDYLNEKRIELVKYLTQRLSEFDFLVPPPGRAECVSTYYNYPLRFLPEKAGIKRDEFTVAVNAEGIMFYQGYTKPLYLQPLYQRRGAFKKGYPFTAPANRDCLMDYEKGLCPNAEKLYGEQMLINEHVRLPHTERDMDDIYEAVRKVSEYLIV